MIILDRIVLANTTLIGYDTQNEISVQKLLRFLPSVTLFESEIRRFRNKIVSLQNAIKV